MTEKQLIKHIKEQSGLAITYLEDGAPNSAARVLMQLSEKLRQHAIERDNALAELSVKS